MCRSPGPTGVPGQTEQADRPWRGTSEMVLAHAWVSRAPLSNMLVDGAGQPWTGPRQKGRPDGAPRNPPWGEGLERQRLRPPGEQLGVCAPPVGTHHTTVLSPGAGKMHSWPPEFQLNIVKLFFFFFF